MLWQGVGKANGYLHGQSIMPFVEGGTLQEQHKDRWNPTNPNAAFPRLTFNEINNTQNSTFWLKDASYLKLRNVQIGYTLGQRLTHSLGVNHVRIYVSGDNLLSINRFWKGFDPESPVGNGEPILLSLDKEGEYKTFQPSLSETFAFVLEGEVCVEIGSDKYYARSGESIYYKAFKEHHIRNNQKGLSRILLVATNSYL